MKQRLTSRIAIVLVGLGLVTASAACTAQLPTAEVGACIDMEALSTSDGTEFPTVECDTEHGGEVVGSVDQPDGDYPGIEALEEQGWGACQSEFETYVGLPVEQSSLMMSFYYPSAATWSRGDREILCIAYLTDGTTTGSWEGSNI
ncbi:MAG: septum formation family protein [Beutenbergiaceae bacterium]